VELFNFNTQTECAYGVVEPDMTMWKLKLDKSPVLDETARLKVAGTTLPGARVVPSWVQVK